MIIKKAHYFNWIKPSKNTDQVTPLPFRITSVTCSIIVCNLWNQHILLIASLDYYRLSDAAFFTHITD